MVKQFIFLLEEFAVIDVRFSIKEIQNVVVFWQRMHRLVRQKCILSKALPILGQAARGSSGMEHLRMGFQKVFEILQGWTR